MVHDLFCLASLLLPLSIVGAVVLRMRARGPPKWDA